MYYIYSVRVCVLMCVCACGVHVFRSNFRILKCKLDCSIVQYFLLNLVFKQRMLKIHCTTYHYQLQTALEPCPWSPSARVPWQSASFVLDQIHQVPVCNDPGLID